MAQSSSNHLHQLIHSMSRSEKRFFKIHLRTHSSKHLELYEELFDSIHDQLVYDESLLTKELKKADQRFPVLKHRLFEKVLDSLEVFGRSNDALLMLRTNLSRAQILLSRGLFNQGYTMLESVVVQAMEIDQADIALEAKRLLLSYLEPDLNGLNNNEQELESWNEEMNSIFQLLQEEWDLILQRAHVFTRMESGIRRPLEDSLVKKGKERPLAKSPNINFLWFHTEAAKAFMRDDSKDALEHTNTCLGLLKEHVHLTRDHKLSVAKMVANGFYSSYRSHDLDQAENFLARLKCMLYEEKSNPGYAEYLALYLQCKLFIENYTHSYYDAEHIRSLEAEFMMEREKLSKHVRSGLDYGFALFHHGVGDNTLSLKAANRILNAKDISRDDEVYARTLIFSNVLHIENGDKEWLTHSARTLKRFLISRNRNGETETALLKYISDIRRSRTPEGEAKALKNYTNSLREVRRKPQERISFEYFDFLRWAEERSTGPKGSYGMVA